MVRWMKKGIGILHARAHILGLGSESEMRLWVSWNWKGMSRQEGL